MTDPTLHRRAGDVSRRATEEAAGWYLDQREGLSANEQMAFLAWLRHSPLHVGEYLAMAQLHGDLKAVAALDTTHGEQLRALAATENTVVPLYSNDDGPTRSDACVTTAKKARPMRRAMPWLAVASVAALTLAIAGLFLYGANEPGVTATLYTSSESRSLSLPDGSLVQLDHDSSIAVRFDTRRRHIEVLRGGAMFDVGKDPARPLQVTLGANVLQDIGTVFEARRSADGGTVTVVSGRVDVLAPAYAWTGAWGAAWDKRLGNPPASGHVLAALTSGQQARVGVHGDIIRATAPVDIAVATAWLPRDIDFEHSTVAEVARRFNAYTTRPLVIDDAAVARMRISGRFHAHDVDAFVAYLQTFPGVQVQRADQQVLILGSTHVAPNRHRRL